MGNFLFRTVAALGLLALLAGASGPGAQPSVPVNDTLAAAGRVALGGETVRVPLEPGTGVSLSRRLADIGGRRVFLILGNLEAAQQPGIVYEVYLGLPPGAAPRSDDPHYVGTLNFFAVAPPNTAPSSRNYDVTALASRLASQRPADDRLAVTIVPTQPSPMAAAARATIGRIALAVQ
jgi:hypothetical protein